MGQHFGTGTFSYQVLKLGEENVTVAAHSYSGNISSHEAQFGCPV